MEEKIVSDLLDSIPFPVSSDTIDEIRKNTKSNIKDGNVMVNFQTIGRYLPNLKEKEVYEKWMENFKEKFISARTVDGAIIQDSDTKYILSDSDTIFMAYGQKLHDHYIKGDTKGAKEVRELWNKNAHEQTIRNQEPNSISVDNELPNYNSQLDSTGFMESVERGIHDIKTQSTNLQDSNATKYSLPTDPQPTPFAVIEPIMIGEELIKAVLLSYFGSVATHLTNLVNKNEMAAEDRESFLNILFQIGGFSSESVQSLTAVDKELNEKLSFGAFKNVKSHNRVKAMQVKNDRQLKIIKAVQLKAPIYKLCIDNTDIIDGTLKIMERVWANFNDKASHAISPCFKVFQIGNKGDCVLSAISKSNSPMMIIKPGDCIEMPLLSLQGKCAETPKGVWDYSLHKKLQRISLLIQEFISTAINMIGITSCNLSFISKMPYLAVNLAVNTMNDIRKIENGKPIPVKFAIDVADNLSSDTRLIMNTFMDCIFGSMGPKHEYRDSLTYLSRFVCTETYKPQNKHVPMMSEDMLKIDIEDNKMISRIMQIFNKPVGQMLSTNFNMKPIRKHITKQYTLMCREIRRAQILNDLCSSDINSIGHITANIENDIIKEKIVSHLHEITEMITMERDRSIRIYHSIYNPTIKKEPQHAINETQILSYINDMLANRAIETSHPISLPCDVTFQNDMQRMLMKMINDKTNARTLKEVCSDAGIIETICMHVMLWIDMSAMYNPKPKNEFDMMDVALVHCISMMDELINSACMPKGQCTPLAQVLINIIIICKLVTNSSDKLIPMLNKCIVEYLNNDNPYITKLLSSGLKPAEDNITNLKESLEKDNPYANWIREIADKVVKKLC